MGVQIFRRAFHRTNARPYAEQGSNRTRVVTLLGQLLAEIIHRAKACQGSREVAGKAIDNYLNLAETADFKRYGFNIELSH